MNEIYPLRASTDLDEQGLCQGVFDNPNEKSWA